MTATVMALIVMVTAAGCDGTSQEDSPPPRAKHVVEVTPTARLQAQALVAETPVWHAHGDYATTAGIIDGVLVATRYAHDVTTEGIDVESGAVLWSMRSSRGHAGERHVQGAFIIESEPHGPVVGVIRPARDDEESGLLVNSVAFVDPGTGAIVKEVERVWVRASKGCFYTDDTCLSLARPGDEFFTDERIDPATLELQPTVSDSTMGYERSRPYGDGLYGVTTETGDQTLVRVEDGAELWRASLGDTGLVADPSADGTVAGSMFDEDADVFVFATTPGEDPETVTAADAALLALDADTGELLWTRDGAIMCPEALLCSGDMVYESTGEDGEYTVELADLRIERVDLRTGVVQWAKRLGRASGFANDAFSEEFVSPSGVWVLESEEATMLIDTATGDTTPLEGGRVACRHAMRADVPSGADPWGEKVSMIVGVAYYACDAAAQEPIGALLTRAAIRSTQIGVWGEEDAEDSGTERQLRVVRTPAGLSAYRF